MKIEVAESPKSYHAAFSVYGSTSYQMIWVRLATLDNHPQQFWKTFTAALSLWDVMFTDSFRQSGFPDENKKIASFVEKLVKTAKHNPLFIIITDSNYVRDFKIEAFLHALLKVQSKHLVISLVSADHDDADTQDAIRANRFRCFSEQEEIDYYSSQGIQLSPEEFRAVRTFTEGWATAVILLAQRLLSEDRHTIFMDFPSYIHGWIVENYRDRFQGEELQVGLCLALLEDFPMEMVRSLNGWDSERTMQLFENSPFLRFNAETNRFSNGVDLRRYILQALPRHLSKKEQNHTLIRMGDWYRERGYKINAIDCYRKAGSNSKVLQVIQQWTFPTPSAQARCYVEAIQDMPASFLERHPLLYVISALCLFTLGRYDAGEHLLETFCTNHDQGEQTPEEIRSVLGEAYLAWSHRATVGCDTGKALHCMKRAAALLPEGSNLVQGKANYSADKPVLLLPSPEAGSVEESLTYQQALEAGEYYVRVNNGGYAGAGSLATAEWHYFTHSFKEVETHATRALALALEWRQYDIICSTYFLLMRFNLAKGNYKRMMESYDRLRENAAKVRYEAFFTMPDLATSWLAIMLGRRQDVSEWIVDDKLNRQLLTPWNYGWDHVLQCMYLLEIHAYAEIITRVNGIPESFLHNWWRIPALQMKLIQAFAYHYLGEDTMAMELFELVYHWLHANNLIMLMVEFGNHMALLTAAYRKVGRGNIPGDWLDRLERMCKSQKVYVYSIRRKHQEKMTIHTNILEQLTPSEQRALLLLVEGFTTAQIAEQTGKTVSTVKTTLSNIYQKMGASGSDEAVQMAIQAGIHKYVRL